MLRFAEIGLFLVPFALYAAWLLLGARAGRRLVWLTAGAIALLAGTTVWYGLHTGLRPGEPYIPAQLRNGVIVQGHGG